jgi:drug/metabolite transporter (DMT)-like permease
MHDSARPKQNPLLGIGLRVGATSCFGLMAAMIKLAHDAGANTAELVFYRSLVGMVPLLAWIGWTRNAGAWRTSRPGAHLWRATIGLSSMAFGFTALAYLPLAEATTIGFAAPLFAVILSALILGELVGPHRWGAVAIGFVGVLIVMQPDSGRLPGFGLTMALLSALCVAGATITIRQIGKTEATQTIVLWFTGMSILVSGLFMPVYGQRHDASILVTLVAIGLIGGVGQLLHTAALRMAPVSVVAPFDYFQLLWAVTLGWLIWDTHPPGTTWAGAAVIIASGLYTLYREHRLGREETAPAPLI